MRVEAMLRILKFSHCISGSSIYRNACSYPESSVTDPDSLIPDPAFRLNTNPDPVFLRPKIGKNLQLEKNVIFMKKNCNLLIPRPP